MTKHKLATTAAEAIVGTLPFIAATSEGRKFIGSAANLFVTTQRAINPTTRWSQGAFFAAAPVRIAPPIERVAATTVTATGQDHHTIPELDEERTSLMRGL